MLPSHRAARGEFVRANAASRPVRRSGSCAPRRHASVYSCTILSSDHRSVRPWPSPRASSDGKRGDRGIRSLHLRQPAADVIVDAVQRSTGVVVVAVEVLLTVAGQTPGEIACLHLPHVADEAQDRQLHGRDRPLPAPARRTGRGACGGTRGADTRATRPGPPVRRRCRQARSTVTGRLSRARGWMPHPRRLGIGRLGSPANHAAGRSRR